MKYDYFVSSKFRNKPAVLDLVKRLRKKGKKVYCFFENTHVLKLTEQDTEKVMREFENKPDWTNDSYVKGIFEEDMKGLKNSKAFILLLPAGKSCHIEAGAAYGLGKKCILIGEQKEAESLYLIFREFHKDSASFLKKL